MQMRNSLLTDMDQESHLVICHVVSLNIMIFVELYTIAIVTQCLSNSLVTK